MRTKLMIVKVEVDEDTILLNTNKKELDDWLLKQ